jgi:hypothetical protein
MVESTMAQIVTRCPMTGHYMFIGIDVAAEQFSSLPDQLTRKFCPFCACEHAWYRKDSKLVNQRPVAARGVQRAS